MLRRGDTGGEVDKATSGHLSIEGVSKCVTLCPIISNGEMKMIGAKRLFPWLMMLALVLVLVVGCQAPEIDTLELIPQSANLIANIQVSQIINDPDLRNAYNSAQKEPGQPKTVEEALKQAVEQTGIDFTDFTEAVVFADLTTLDDAEYLGFIVKGNFDEERFIDNIEEKTGEKLTTSDYKGYKLYIDEEDMGEKRELGIAFLSNKMLLFGTTKAIKDAIDVSEGDRQPAGGMILDTYNRLDDALIKMAIELPQEARKTLTEEQFPSEFPTSLEFFTDIDTVGFTLNKKADIINIQINTHFLSTDSAQDASDTLSGAISLFKGMLQDLEIKELLGKIEVAVTNSWVTIAFDITVSEIEKLTETFQP